MLGQGQLIKAIHDHVLLDFFYLLQLLWQVLIWCLELEVGLEIHLSLLLEQVCCNHGVHVLLLLLLDFLLALHAGLNIFFLEVFELHFFFLPELAVVQWRSKHVIPWVRLLLNILASVARVALLAEDFGTDMGTLKCVFVLLAPLLMRIAEPLILCSLHA